MKRFREYPHPVLKLLLNITRKGECWEWTGARAGGGYGQIAHRGKRIQAHRYSYQLRFGPIPKGLVLDHLCRNKRCVNPEHLEPVTNRENVLRGDSPVAIKIRTNKCMRGHELTDANVIVLRLCRTCNYEATRRNRRSSRKPRVLRTARSK